MTRLIRLKSFRRNFTKQNSVRVLACLMSANDEIDIQVQIYNDDYNAMSEHNSMEFIKCLVIGKTQMPLQLTLGQDLVFKTLQDNTGSNFVGNIVAIHAEPHKYSSFAHRFAVKMTFQ